jgi:hypothetical protein
MRRYLASLALLVCASQSWAAQLPQPEVTLRQLPLEFEANRGQHAPAVRFVSRTGAYQVALTNSGALFTLPASKQSARRSTVTLRFEGANRGVQPQGESQTEHLTNYLFSDTAERQYVDIPNFERVRYLGVYPGVDAVFYGRNGKIEYDLILQPGADARRVELSFAGARKLQVNSQGDLLVHTANGVLRQHKPAVYQERGGQRQEVVSKYRVHGNKVRFELAAYDARYAVTVDPILSYSTFLGGANGDIAAAIAVDAAGNAYVTGQTYSTNYPVAGAYQSSLGGTSDVFVSKLNPQGTGLVYSTYIGGRRSYSDSRAIAVDSSGSAYIAGTTNSNTYPATSGAYSAGISGGGAIVTKLSPAGNSLVYSTYLKGATPASIKVDAAGNAYIAGQSAASLPTTPGAFQTTVVGTSGSGFVTKLNAAGSALVYSTYFGGGGQDTINAIALDPAGNAYVVGTTNASAFPVTAGAFQTTLHGGYDAFVAKLNATGSGLVFSTYLGGATDEHGMAIAVDASGKVYVAGDTASLDFPRVNGYSKSLAYNFVTDAFITVFNADGASLAMSSYLGGRACLTSTVFSCYPAQPNDGATAIAVDPSGTHIFLGGFLSSVDVGFLIDPIQPNLNGSKDAFLAKIEVDPFTQRIMNVRYATRFGGNDQEQVNGLGIDAAGNAYITGTSYADLPTTQGAFRVASAGSQEAFVAKIGALGVPIMLEGGCDGTLTSQLRASVPLNVVGTVAFTDNGATLATVPIQNGQAIYTAAATVGTHKYTAVRSSDGAVSKPVYCKLEQ